MIKFKNVYKKYKELILFENLNNEFSSKITKISGSNGSGKSVLLKLIVGYSSIDSGNIYYDENILLGENGDFLRDAGVSINAPQFVKSWTGFENLLYLLNITKKCSKSELDYLIEYFGLEKDINKKYKNYSLGMQQKMRIIQAVMDNPKYLILDEPFDALDKSSKQLTKIFLQNYLACSENRQLIYVSHDAEDDDFANEIYEIDNNKLVRIK